MVSQETKTTCLFPFSQLLTTNPMRLLTTLLVVTAASPALGGIWGSDPQPTPWTQEQLEKSQKYLRDVKEDSFNSWNEGRLRQFLLDNGVIEPKGTKVFHCLSKPKKPSYILGSRNNSFKWRKSNTGHILPHLVLFHEPLPLLCTGTSMSKRPRARRLPTLPLRRKPRGAELQQRVVLQVAHTLLHRMRAPLSLLLPPPPATRWFVLSMTAGTTSTVSITLLIVSLSFDVPFLGTWDDNQMRTWLEEHGIIKPKQQMKRDELLAKMKQFYLSTTDPVWKAWSDSYIREWLIAHNIITQPRTPREKLVVQMEKYYYDTNGYVWSQWTDSDLRQYLIDHKIIKSDAQLKREKMEKLVQDNWSATSDAFWSSWTESEVRAWLVEHGVSGTLYSSCAPPKSSINSISAPTPNSNVTSSSNYSRASTTMSRLALQTGPLGLMLALVPG